MRRTGWIVAGVVAAWMGMPSTGAAQYAFGPDAPDPGEDRLRLGGFFSAGLGGEVELDSNIPFFSGEGDLEATVGFGFLADYAVLRYLAIGGLIRNAYWETDGVTPNRPAVLDFSVYPRARFPLGSLEVYLAVPVGMTLDWFRHDDVDTDTGVGWNVGFVFGAQFFVTDAIGAFLQMGAQFRGFEHHGTAPAFGDVEADFRLRQFVLEMGVAFFP